MTPARDPCHAYVLTRCLNESLPPDYKRCSAHPVEGDKKKPICSCAQRIAAWLRTLPAMQAPRALADAVERGDWR